MGISYLFNNPNICGEVCPVCGKKSWDIFKCDICGEIFCKSCKAECVKEDKDEDGQKTGNIDVTCKCGSTTLFIDW